jgi:chromosome segregation ATPase
MDEIDASLDTYMARRVGQLILKKSQTIGAQYILVSHRPEIHESAARIIGIYSCHGFPKSFSLGFEP